MTLSTKLSIIITLMFILFACSDDGGQAQADAGEKDGEELITETDNDTGTNENQDTNDPSSDAEGETKLRDPVQCSNGPCACDNGKDDDGDGLVDGADPECTGAYDDSEDSFATGIPGDNIDFCQDCFFDGDSGGGPGSSDPCQYHTDCLYGKTPTPRGNAGCFNCKATAGCIDNCRPRTPNGCDCFGCCQVRVPDGTTVNIVLTGTCSIDKIENETACPRCVQSTECVNECGRCELCPGKTEKDLPADCSSLPDDTDTGDQVDTDPPVNHTCDDGEQVCSDRLPCPSGTYCQQGCCLQLGPIV